VELGLETFQQQVWKHSAEAFIVAGKLRLLIFIRNRAPRLNLGSWR